MRQGVHGVLPEPAMREAFARASFAGFGTAACDAGVSGTPAVFGLPAGYLIFFLFANNIAEGKDLTVAHVCATMPCVAYCACGSGKFSTDGEGGHKSAHSARVTGTLPSPVWAVTVTR